MPILGDSVFLRLLLLRRPDQDCPQHVAVVSALCATHPRPYHIHHRSAAVLAIQVRVLLAGELRVHIQGVVDLVLVFETR